MEIISPDGNYASHPAQAFAVILPFSLFLIGESVNVNAHVGINETDTRVASLLVQKRYEI